MAPIKVTFHPLPTTHAFCHSSNAARSAVVFLHGLTAGPLRSPFATALAGKLPEGYALWEPHMRSSFTGFGFSSLANDVADIAELVTYLRGLEVDRIVLLGASTGCQDIMEYVSGNHQVPPVDGYVLTCPVSDREFGEFALGAGTLAASVAHAKEMIDGGKKDEIMPSGVIPPIFSSPVSAYRWHSLAAKGGDDDYFSSDLDEQTLLQTFGKIDKPVLILTAGKDELVPPTVDRDALVGRWKNAVGGGHWSSLSQCVPEADHQVLDVEAQGAFADLVAGFLETPE